jgi:hypothetical protein
MDAIEELQQMIADLRRSYAIDLYGCSPENAAEAHNRCLALISDVIAVLERAVAPGVLASDEDVRQAMEEEQ